MNRIRGRVFGLAAAGLAVLAFPAPAANCERTLTQAEFARPVSERERAELVETLAASVERLYVDPDRARLIARALRRHLAEGRYRNVADASALAALLAGDMRGAVPDLHLQVRAHRVEAEAATAGTVADGPAARAAGRERFSRSAAYDGYGIVRVEILPGNVGVLRLAEFWSPLVAGDALAGAMAVLRRSDALIIDLRDSYGGHEDVVALIMGYFLRNPQLLSTTTNRRTHQTIQQRSAPYVPGSPASLIPEQVPVYVLTSSRRTFSAAEMLALSLKRRRGATIIGEPSRGGANGGEFLPLSCRFDAFIPFVSSEMDGFSWEGVGVTPDIRVSEAQALDIAYRTALATLSTRPIAPDEDSLAHEIREERADLLRRLPAPAGE